MTPTPLNILNNRYRVLQTLGAGGFGNTFLAEDTHMPSGRRCVIKQLKPVTHDPKTYEVVKERFQREAAVLEELGEGHPQIPRLFAYFSEASQFYLVQEWIEGDTLTKKVEQAGRLNENEVKAILVSLLPVLDFVHSRRMVHRDIKPDNIIIRKRDGLPVLIDFGAVKEAMNTVVNNPANSAESMVIGTPGFMSGEQAAGRPTYASDLYSLGLTAVYLLTGKLPQELQTDDRTGELLWRQLAPNLHSNLATVIDRAIRFTPRDRFSTAREMLNALQSDGAASEMATVAVAPGGLPQAPRSTPPIANPVPPQTVPVGTSPVIQQHSGQKRVIFGAVIAGAVLASAIALAVGLTRSPNNSSPVSSSSDPTSEQPTAEQPPSPTPPPPPENTPTPIPPESSSEPSAQAPSSQAPSSQAPTASFPTQVIPVPPPETANNNSNSTPPKNVPGFAPGTQSRAVIEELGSPTKNSKGVWPNTRAVLYEEYVPGQVSLGYLFDRDSRRLRQTEASFSPEVQLQTISGTLNQMLSGNVAGDIEQGLESVYERQSNRYRFETGGANRLKGVIERNKSDRIYVAVWEADLH